MSRLRTACGPFFIVAGVAHFVNPKPYEAIVPRYLPAHKELVWASGVAEVAGGVGMLIPATRPRAARFLIAVLVAVFPANLDMALHPERFPKIPGGRRTLIARLPLQLLAAWWVMAAAKPDTPVGEMVNPAAVVNPAIAAN